MYELNNECNEKYKERELRERKIVKRKHKDMFRDSSHSSMFQLSHKRISTMSTKDLPQRASTEELQLTHKEYTTPTLTPLHKREGKNQAQSKERNTS